MARIVQVTTVPGSVRGAERKVTYVLIKDDGSREVFIQEVTGNRHRVAALLASFHEEVQTDDVSFDPRYGES